MFVVIELVNDKLFGMADTDRRLLGCNAAAETEGEDSMVAVWTIREI